MKTIDEAKRHVFEQMRLSQKRFDTRSAVYEAEQDLFRYFVDELDKLEDYKSSIDALESFIINNIPGEPSKNEGIVDTVIRLLVDAYIPFM